MLSKEELEERLYGIDTEILKNRKISIDNLVDELFPEDNVRIGTKVAEDISSRRNTQILEVFE